MERTYFYNSIAKDGLWCVIIEGRLFKGCGVKTSTQVGWHSKQSVLMAFYNSNYWIHISREVENNLIKEMGLNDRWKLPYSDKQKALKNKFKELQDKGIVQIKYISLEELLNIKTHE